jgi:hypothetical protein
MIVIHAMAMRIDLPRNPQRREQEMDDLTTLPLRNSDRLPIDAIQIVPGKKFWTPLQDAVPGRLVEGTLPGDHRARYVLRMPRAWNGGLVVAASSGTMNEYNYDLYFSDYLLSRGYAFASTDKGMRTAVLDGDTVLLPHAPEGHINLWSARLDSLAIVALHEAKEFYGRSPRRTIAVGVSNGGYIARRAAESSSGIYDGALDISGVLWRADRGSVLRDLPLALKAGDVSPWDKSLLERSGMPGLDGQWAEVAVYYRGYWEAVIHLFTGFIDPEFTGRGEDYELDRRPAGVLEAIRGFENTGDLQIPLVSVAGDRDYLISCASHAIAYSELVKERGKSKLHELIIVPNACHIDAHVDKWSFVEPLMPRAHEAFERLERILDTSMAASRS